MDDIYYPITPKQLDDILPYKGKEVNLEQLIYAVSHDDSDDTHYDSAEYRYYTLIINDVTPIHIKGILTKNSRIEPFNKYDKPKKVGEEVMIYFKHHNDSPMGSTCTYTIEKIFVENRLYTLL